MAEKKEKKFKIVSSIESDPEKTKFLMNHLSARLYSIKK